MKIMPGTFFQCNLGKSMWNDGNQVVENCTIIERKFIIVEEKKINVERLFWVVKLPHINITHFFAAFYLHFEASWENRTALLAEQPCEITTDCERRITKVGCTLRQAASSERGIWHQLIDNDWFSRPTWNCADRCATTCLLFSPRNAHPGINGRRHYRSKFLAAYLLWLVAAVWGVDRVKQRTGANNRLSMPICKSTSEKEETVYGGAPRHPNTSRTRNIRTDRSPTYVGPRHCLERHKVT